uniref:Hypothetical conserved protein n=1 Tax=uncultured Bacteroidota bacterium TaxID=152509 RepID=H5SGL1_9BACT|nr:hypothetical conserved protein [uncultured Bacteroidetes bacterium]
MIIGEMQAGLARKLLGASSPPVYVGFNGVDEARLGQLLVLSPSLEKPSVVFIGHGEEGWRTYYKGLDLFMEVLSKVKAKLPSVEGLVVGRWTQREQERLKAQYPDAPVRFVGAVRQLETVLEGAGLYFHPGRGEAWGISVLEAMAAGVPAIVSEWTGAKEAVQKAWPQGVVPLDTDRMAEAILAYFALSPAERQAIGERSREIVRSQYTLAQATQRFQAIFWQAMADIGA